MDDQRKNCSICNDLYGGCYFIDHTGECCDSEKRYGAGCRNLLTEEADGNAAVINGWLKQEGNTVNTMKNALAVMDRDDTDAIMDYLEVNLNENENALMYYCCFGYDGGVLPADHSKLDLDPTTRDWWKQAISEDGLIYTEPYTEFATGQMVVSIAEPLTIGGE